MLVPRYLVPFHPKQLPHYFTDVLIIGGGLAGLRAANAVDARLSVLVITKDTINESNSTYAQGGIAGVLDPDAARLVLERVLDAARSLGVRVLASAPSPIMGGAGKRNASGNTEFLALLAPA